MVISSIILCFNLIFVCFMSIISIIICSLQNTTKSKYTQTYDDIIPIVVYHPNNDISLSI